MDYSREPSCFNRVARTLQQVIQLTAVLRSTSISDHTQSFDLFDLSPAVANLRYRFPSFQLVNKEWDWIQQRGVIACMVKSQTADFADNIRDDNLGLHGACNSGGL